MKRISFFLFFFVCAPLVASCTLFDSADEKPVPLEEPGLVTYALYYPEKAQIVVAPFDDPTNFQAVTDTNGFYNIPRFSPDQAKLTFIDELRGGPVFLYDAARKTVEAIPDKRNDPPLFYGVPSSILWDVSEDRFFFTNAGIVGISFRLLAYNFSDTTIDVLSYSASPLSRKGQDTLLVLSPGPTDNEVPTLYLYDLTHDVLTRIDNPHLASSNNRVVQNPDWSDERQQIVFALRTPGERGNRITVTDLTGSFFQTYTTGVYWDDYPRWGPNGTIVFERIEPEDVARSDRFWLMILDVETGEVREYVTPEMVVGTVGMGKPDF